MVVDAQQRTASKNPPSLEVVIEVAKREGIPPGELQPPLFEVVDPDALNALLTNEPSTEEAVSISFDYAGYRITVDSNQTLTVK